MYPIKRRQVLTTSYDCVQKSKPKRINLKNKLDKFSRKMKKNKGIECERDERKGDPNLVFRFFNEESDRLATGENEHNEFFRKIPQKIRQVRKLIKNFR